MVAVLTGCRMDLVGTPSQLNEHRNHSCSLVGAVISGTVTVSIRRSIHWSESLTIESSLMVRCGYGHKPPENVSNRL